MHVLLIEDDLDLGRALVGALKAEGITSEWLRRTVDARHDLEGYSADCVLLDLALPGGTGLDLLARWRGSSPSAVPIIIITANSSLKDRLAGLNAGADDFLVKPFATAELVARIHAVVRRSAQQVSDVWTFGDLQLEPRCYQARLDGVELDLSPREFRLLLELARQAGRVVSKATLSQRLEPTGEPVDFGAIEVHLSNLRRKIGAQRIRTVRGVGYIFCR